MNEYFEPDEVRYERIYCQICGIMKSECHGHSAPSMSLAERRVWRKYGGDLGANISKEKLEALVRFEFGIWDE